MSLIHNVKGSVLAEMDTGNGEMHQGRIVWFDLKTGRGCVVCRDTLEDYLFDSKGVDSPSYFFHEGEEVLFEIEETKKGWWARNVCLARNQES